MTTYALDGLSRRVRPRLVTAKDAEIDATIKGIRETWQVNYMASRHCTGEPAFAAMKKAFGERYVYAGLGTRLKIASP